jgi:hypothetical protein
VTARFCCATPARMQGGSAQRSGAGITVFWILLAVVTLGGFALRIGYIAADRWDYVPLGDAEYYHETANHLADGRGIINPFLYDYGLDELPAADHPPLYTVYLAGFSLVGLDTPNQHMVASALIGSLTVLLAGLTGRRIGGDRLGVLAAVLVAVYPNVWRHDGMLMSETVAVFTTMLTVWLAYRYLDRPTPVAIALVGGAIGFATLARSELILLALFVVVPLLLVTRDRTWAERAKWLGVAATACIVVIAPWVIRNWVQIGRPMLSSQLEVTLATTNCDSTYYGDLAGYWDFLCSGPILEEAGIDDPRDPRFNDVLGEAALDYIRDNAGRVPTVMALRVGRTLTIYQPDQQIMLETFAEGGNDFVARLGLWSFRAFALAGIAGAVILRRRGVPVFPLLAPVAAVLVTVLLLYATVRFRAPADLALALLTAVAADAAWNAAAGRRRKRERPVAPQDDTDATPPVVVQGQR